MVSVPIVTSTSTWLLRCAHHTYTPALNSTIFHMILLENFYNISYDISRVVPLGGTVNSLVKKKFWIV